MEAEPAAQMRQTAGCHVVAMPYPGRGHINPMINFCKLLASRNHQHQISISFVVTEEWLGFLASEPLPPNFRFATIPNVIPSEIGRAADLTGFLVAAMTKLEEPFERLLDRLGPPRASVIVYDAFMGWVVDVGNRRNIPLVSFVTTSAFVFSVFYHLDLLAQNGHFFPADLSERGNEVVNYIPGLPPTRLADLPTFFDRGGFKIVRLLMEGISRVRKAQFLLFASIYEIESHTIDALKAAIPVPIHSVGPAIPVPIHSVGPAIPYFSLQDNEIDTANVQWLNSQPKASILYISQGSFLSVPKAQMDEIIAGLADSGVRFFWVAPGEADASRIRDGCSGQGVVVRWCDQLKVLCHSSIGGFWSHCGWNSTKEGVFAGLPFLTYPIIWDQVPNSKMIVEEWKIGWNVRRRGMGAESELVTREEIAGTVKRFMDVESEEGREMRRRAKEVGEMCRRAASSGGSVDANIDAFLKGISGSDV